MSIDDLESAAGADGYVIAKHAHGYTVRLRGAVGQHQSLHDAISSAISQDKSDADDIDNALLDNLPE